MFLRSLAEIMRQPEKYSAIYSGDYKSISDLKEAGVAKYIKFLVKLVLQEILSPTPLQNSQHQKRILSRYLYLFLFQKVFCRDV